MHFTVGTDCSGMEAPIQALRNLSSVKFTHNFSCDIDRHVRETIRANFQPSGEIYSDITARSNENLYADVYVVGFPCQPFSLQGMMQGFDDTKGRGKIIFYVLKYIMVNRPKLFVLENVKGLMSIENGSSFEEILTLLDAIGDYNVHYKVLNTKDHGVPHNRPRLYFVGIRKDVDQGTFAFPEKIPCPSIEEFLDPRNCILAKEGAPPTSQRTAFANLNHAKRKVKDLGSNPDDEPWVVDIDSTLPRMSCMNGLSPCITARRGDGHWVTNRGRRFHKTEMMRLQGMSPLNFNVVVSNTQLGKQLGNTMSVNVVERVLVNALPAAGLVKQGCLPDRWKSGEALVALQKTKDCSLEILPDNDPKRARHERIRQALVGVGCALSKLDAT